MSWRVVPLKALFRRRNETGQPELPLLSVYRDFGVVLRDGREDNFNRPGEDLSTYRVVHAGDLVLNKMKTWQGSLGVSHYGGIVSPAYYVCKRVADVDAKFIHHLLRSQHLIDEYGARSKGIRPAQWDLPWDAFRDIRVALPGRDTQRTIAEFLDSETARIDALVENKRRLLAMARTRYIASIDVFAEQAGTRCLPLKRVARVAYGLGQPPPLSDDGIPIIRATNIDTGRINEADLIRARAEDLPLERAPLLAEGEILVVRSGALTGDSALITAAWAGSAPGYDLRVTPAGIEPRFLAHQLLGRRALDQIDLARSRAAQPHLNAEELGELSVWAGDSPSERTAADELDQLRSWLDRLESLLREQLHLLSEHRRALITAAVTGQLEVSRAAA